jgi:hypothetical protein
MIFDRSEAKWRDLRFPTSGAKSAPDMGYPRLVVVLDPYLKQIQGAPSLRSKVGRPQPVLLSLRALVSGLPGKPNHPRSEDRDLGPCTLYCTFTVTATLWAIEPCAPLTTTV